MSNSHNPFVNQVFLDESDLLPIRNPDLDSHNPFVNQVFLDSGGSQQRSSFKGCHNPFVNQVFLDSLPC